MSKELKKLIEQVLAEKITNKLVSPEDELYDTSTRVPADDKESNIQNWNKLGVAKSNVRKGDYIKPYEKLASKESPANELSWDDVESTINKMITGKRFSKDDKERFKTLKWMQNRPELKKEIDSIIQKVVLGSVEQGDPNAAGKVRDLTSKITSYIDKLPDQRVSAFASQQMPLRSLETSEKEFTGYYDENKNWIPAKMPKVSPYLVDLFSSVEGDSIQAKLESISDFSKHALDKTLGEWAKGKNEFAPFTYAKVLNFLAEEIKKTGATEAGFQFERWIALLLSLPVAGAEQGAADNLGKIGADVVYTSAKLYADIYGENSPSQAKDKLLTTTDSGKNKIYYFIAHKETGGSEGGQGGKVQGFHFIDAINLYMVEISENMSKQKDASFEEAMDALMEKEGSDRRGPYGTLEGRFVFDNGTKRTKPWELKIKVQKKKVSENQAVLTPQDKSLAGNVEAFKFATIYLPQGKVEENQLETTAEFLANRVGEIQNQPITQAIMNAATSLKNIEANTDSYVGQSKQKKGSATQYIKKITDDYIGLKDLYNQIFNYGEKGSDRDSSELYLENSKSTLDQLIEAIVKEKLLK